MATLTIESGAAAIELDVQGADPPQMKRSIAAFSAQIQLATAGSFRRAISIGANAAALHFDTDSGSSEFVRRELLVGAGIELQVWDREDPEGTLLEVIRYREQKFEVAISQVGSIEVTLPREYLNSVLAEKDHHIVVLVDGIERARFIAEDVVEVPVSEDERQSVRVLGRGVSAELEWGAIAPYDFGGPNQRVKRAWAQSTRAQALHDLFAEIQNRGILTHVTVDGWNGTHDSVGNLWPDLVDLEFDAGGSFLNLLDQWVEYGIEWIETWDFRLQLATQFGRNLADAVVLYPAHTVRQQELSISRRDIRTVMFTQDGSGGVQRIFDAAARTEWGDREQYVVFGDSLGSGTASANGYLLLDLVKDAVKERRVEIDPNAPGRRPFVDFDLGDVVGVWFGDQIYEFRVLAIAMSSNADGKTRCEVVLEYMLEAQRKRRQRLLNASTAGGGVSSAPQTVYALGGGFVATTTATSITPLVVNAFLSTLGKLGFSVIGTCSEAMTVTVEVMYGEIALETFKYTVPAGLQTVEVTWLWTQIPQGEVPMRLRITTSSGTFTVANQKAQFWIEAKSIAGKQTVAPIMFVSEEISLTVSLPTVWDEVDSAPAPFEAIQLEDEETVDLNIEIPALEDEVEDPIFVLTATSTASDDGWVGASSFTSSGALMYSGNSGSESREAWFKVAIPVDFTSKTIVDAYLIGVTDVAAGETNMNISAVDSAAPAAPTSRSEFDAFTYTSATREWTMTPTAGGTFRSPSVLNILNELMATYGAVTSVVIIVADAASSSGRMASFRAKEYGAAFGMKLVVEYLDY